MKTKEILYTAILAVFGALAGGCSLDVPYENQFSDPDAISTPGTARELLATAYSALPNPEYDLSVFADDFAPTAWARNNPSSINAYNWQPQAFQDLSASLWPQYYSVVSTINALLERMPAIVPQNDDERTLLAEISAEAKALKAYCYFQLVRMYGPDYADDPDADAIVLKDAVKMQNLKRSSVKASIEAIRTLLDESMQVTTRTMAETHWFSLDATRYLAAEVELYAGNYGRAAELAKTLVDEIGADALAPAVYNNLWTDDNCAARIFTYGNVNKSEIFYLDIVYDRDAGDYFSVAPALVSAYGADDCRRAWCLFETTSPTLGFQSYMGKYNTLRKQQKAISQIVKMRLSGAVFILAQAYALDGENEEKAVGVLNDYLTRRGAATVDPGLRGTPLLKAILAEKHKEFVGEGERWFDLKHYRRTVLADWTSGQSAERRIAADDYRWLWPIPRDEYLYNENMSQNPVWPKNSFND